MYRCPCRNYGIVRIMSVPYINSEQPHLSLMSRKPMVAFQEKCGDAKRYGPQSRATEQLQCSVGDAVWENTFRTTRKHIRKAVEVPQDGRYRRSQLGLTHVGTGVQRSSTHQQLNTPVDLVFPTTMKKFNTITQKTFGTTQNQRARQTATHARLPVPLSEMRLLV